MSRDSCRYYDVVPCKLQTCRHISRTFETNANMQFFRKFQVGTLYCCCYDSIVELKNCTIRRVAGDEFFIVGVKQKGYLLTHRCLLEELDFELFIAPVHVNRKHWGVMVRVFSFFTFGEQT